jgi:hypothetical protein
VDKLTVGAKIEIHGYSGRIIRTGYTFIDVEVSGVIDRYELLSTREVVERIKDILAPYIERSVNNIDVSDVLRITNYKLANKIKNNSQILSEVSQFCERTGLNVNNIFFKKNC